MKQYNKTHLPDVINYKGEDYKRDYDATEKYRSGEKLPSKYHIQVNVLSNNLKGRTDLHGKPYQAHVYIYTNELGFLRNSLPVVTMIKIGNKWVHKLYDKI